MKKISVITGNRSEYWLLSYLINLLNDSKLVNLSLYITGSHLSKKYGQTKNDIDLNNIKKVNFLDLKISQSNSRSIAKSMSIALLKFEKYFSKERPDLIILLGDRYESFIAATAATILNIPIAHFHGGELTEGIYDDYWRHCITKLSHIHFVSNKQYGKRVEQLGEHKKYIKIVGAPGIDLLKNYNFLNKNSLSLKFNFIFSKKNILVAYHSNTLNHKNNIKEFENLLKVVYSFEDTNIFISFPGHDLGSDEIIKLIKKYKNKYKKNTFVFKNLGSVNFLSLVKIVDLVVGNSSSAIIESPYLKTPSINVGMRQKGRLQDTLTFNSSSNSKSIIKKIKFIFKNKNIISNYKCNKIYGNGNASIKAFRYLLKVDLKRLKKTFYDIK